ncbi:MAG: CofH family radical SAM protein, partial [bacterium]
KHDDGYVLTKDEIGAKIEELIALGGRQILLQGGHHPDLKLEWYEDLLSWMRNTYGIHIHGFSPPEIWHFHKLNDLPLDVVISRLKDAGLSSIPGGGAEILVDRVRLKLSRIKCTTDQWLEVMRVAHGLGLRSSATMMFGHIETLADRVEHLERLRLLQDETGGFTAFICWTFQPENTALKRLPKLGSFEYLKTQAIARLYLDNFRNVQSSWVTQGPKIGQIALLYGANDMGSTMLEENVVSAAGTTYKMNAQQLEMMARELGLEPRRRNFFYDLLEPQTPATVGAGATR